MRIAVLGGGLSGLTAAYYLHRMMPRADLRLFEASGRVGGVIQTERRQGWLVEQGADCFSTNPPDALRLCRDLGVADELVEPRTDGRRAMIARRGRLYPVPEGFVLMRPTRMWPVLRSPLLSWPGKVRLAAERFVRPRGGTEDESLASFVRRRLGREALERLVQPLVAGIYTADAEQLSMQATMPQFLEMERQHGRLSGSPGGSAAGDAQVFVERQSSGARYAQFRAFPGGMERLFQRITETLPPNAIHLNRQARSLERTDDGRWRIRFNYSTEEIVDGVLLALPARAAAKLLLPTVPSAAGELEAIEYASSAIVTLGIKTSQVARLPDAFGFVVPAIENRRILAGSFASHKFLDRAPPGHTLIRAFIGGALQPKLLEHSDAELMEMVRDELAELIGMRGQPEWMAVRRWDRAMPQYHVGHTERAQRIEREISNQAGLELAGNALHGVGIAPVVRTARNAAERLAKSLTDHA